MQFGHGAESPNCLYVQHSLGIPDLAVFQDISSGPGGLGAPLAAAIAVASGACETALCFRTMTQAGGRSGQAARSRSSPAGDPTDEFMLPYGWGGVMQKVGMSMQLRSLEYGTSSEEYGYVALNARRWAAGNERAVQRSLLTMDDYLNSRMVSDPVRLLDCDYPINGSAAAIITTAARARDCRTRPVYIDSLAFATGSYPDWVQAPNLISGAIGLCTDRLWRRSSFRPADVDVAQIYDGFTLHTISWIEALGLCGPGEFGDWVDGGRRIGPGGEMPVNTAGGHLGEGRMHAFGLFNEAVLQLRGACGERQVPDARVAVVTSADGPTPGAMLLNT
jgi:acetyl-CoA acetyltransferase